MISLVQTSRDRQPELKRFLDSLNSQVGIDFKDIQLIFIDQGDNRDVFNGLNQNIDFQYIKTSPCSLSKARNIGLKQVKGDFIGFPDDDCWYEPYTLCHVLNELHRVRGGVVARGIDENGNNTNGKTPNSIKKLTLYNHFGAISYTIFLKFIKNILFDENMGVGSQYNLGAGEESDYLIRCINSMEESVWYYPSIVVRHPSSGLGNFSNIQTKAYSYARGNGYLMRKNRYPFLLVVNRILRPFFGMIVFTITGNINRSRKSYYLFRGNIEGYLFRMP